MGEIGKICAKTAHFLISGVINNVFLTWFGLTHYYITKRNHKS